MHPDSEKHLIPDYAPPSSVPPAPQQRFSPPPMLGVLLLIFTTAATLSTVAFSRNLLNSIAICAAVVCFLLAVLGFLHGLVKLFTCTPEQRGPVALATLLYLAIALGLCLIVYWRIPIGTQEYEPA